MLDQQLQDTIFEFEHKQGVMQEVEKYSAQLAAALQAGTNIITTTPQKFPFVVAKVAYLPPAPLRRGRRRGPQLAERRARDQDEAGTHRPHPGASYLR